MSRRTPTRGNSRLRPLNPTVVILERRELMSATPDLAIAGFVARPAYDVHVSPLTGGSPPAGAFTPAQIRQAYGFSNVKFGAIQGDGTGQTIAIVDAQDSPNIQSDLNTFSAQFGLPSTTISRVNQTGGTSYPATDSTGGWELETALDVEWAHAVAPGAKILLVEANSASGTDLLAAVDYAAAHAGVVSMSWGGGEFSGESTYNNHFVHAGVAFVASSGDAGAPVSWPTSSPDVIAVGGTALYTGTGSTWSSETGWSGSGGGPSAYEVQPAYQKGVVTQTTTQRANPDVAYDASPSTGFAVYDSNVYNGSIPGWTQVGGTSAGAPQWAALLAIADQGRALNGLAALNATNPQDILTQLYAGATSGEFHDITTGTSTGSPNYSAGAGYDYVTGLGSPKADLVIASLSGTPVVTNDHLTIAAPTATTAGNSFTVTVTARNASGATDAGYLGTVHFTSSDGQAGLPANYTFTAADAGSHTFTVAYKTAGTQSVTATDTATAAITGTAGGTVVSPAAASQFLLTGLASTATAGTGLSFTITAKDPYGNVATGYTGTVHFTSTDAAAVLPANYTFAAADKGVHAFSVTFKTAGTQSVTAADSASGPTVTSSAVTVSPAAPLSLGATAVSTSQINLSWSAATGATGYLVERSTSPTSGWVQIGSTTSGVTTYASGGLAAGTTYYYRVRATGGGVNSAYSNTASATTQGTVAATSTSLWGSTYVPSIDAYASGYYEVGVKFRSDVAGTVTGARFFKQTWMNGYTHIGHLWSSTGVLLATAQFTGETASGWEQVNFSAPVSIAANTTYIVSFSTGGGYFGISSTYFASAGVDNGVLHAPSTAAAGGNGVYRSGTGVFPYFSGGGMNFWADVVFKPSSGSSLAVVNGGSGSQGGVGSFTAIAGGGNSGTYLAPPTNSGGTSTPHSSSGATETRTPPAQARVATYGSWPYRGTVPQTLSFSPSRGKGLFSSVFGGF